MTAKKKTTDDATTDRVVEIRQGPVGAGEPDVAESYVDADGVRIHPASVAAGVTDVRH